jgi:serine/threonine protein kinase, bacterial
VKPSNILIARDDFAYLIDFGIARAAGETALTSTGATIGTWAYMAPERFQTGTADARADIYALAGVLYECLTGELPYPGDSLPQQMHAHLYVEPPRPSEERPDISTGFDEVVARGMAKDPDQRYATTVELATAAHNAITVPIQQPTPPPATLPATEAGNLAGAQPKTLMAGSPAPAKPAPPPQRTPPRQPWWRRPAITIPAALLTVAVIAAAIVITSRQHENSNGRQIPLPTSQTQTAQPAYGSQVTLPFTGLNTPDGVAVDTAGSIYVTDGGNRVVKLAAGSSTQSVLPFTGLNGPRDVAVDTAGNLYVPQSCAAQMRDVASEMRETGQPRQPQQRRVDTGNWQRRHHDHCRVEGVERAGEESQTDRATCRGWVGIPIVSPCMSSMRD